MEHSHFGAATLLSAIILLICFPHALLSQDAVQYHRAATQLEDIMPPTPEAAGVSKYTDAPFSHCDGTAGYSVPVYTLQGKEITIPISLDYRSDGIKLDEIPGVAGLGWTLHAGGCITREVVYMPDEFLGGQFYQLPSDELLGWLEEGSHNTQRLQWLEKVLWNRIDCNPDRYSYSVCGLQGSFIIRPGGEIVQLEGDGVLIAYDGTSDAFTLTGPDGTLYRLSSRERGTRQASSEYVTPFTGQQTDWTATTAWYLSSVTSPSGAETASFSYTSGGTWNRDTYSATQSLTMNNAGGSVVRTLSSGSSTTATAYTTLRLSSVSLNGFTASFTYADVTGRPYRSEASDPGRPHNYPSRLTGIAVSTGSTELLHIDVGTQKDPNDGRIVLSSLSLYHGGVLDDRWTFTYDTRTSSVSRYSQDWFGYFNAGNESSGLQPGNPTGGSGNGSGGSGGTSTGRTTLCPYLIDSSTGSVTLSYGTPDADAARYMSLLRADHDGAVTAWEYEGRTCTELQQTVPVGIRVRRIAVLDGDDTVRVRSFTYADPHKDGPARPAPVMYLTTAAKQHLADGGGTLPADPHPALPRISYTWGWTLHDSPVVDGRSILSSRVRYGTVTEDVTGALSDAAAGGTVRTVHTYSFPDHIGYNTIDRYPATWRTTMRQAIGTALEDEYYGYAQDGYRASGPDDAALHASRTDYAWDPGTGPAGSGSPSFAPVRREESQFSELQRPAVLAGYRAALVMERYASGDVRTEDIYHYPLWTYRSSGQVPTAVTRIDCLLNGNDTTVLQYTHTARGTDLEKPWRINTVSLDGADRNRMVHYHYPDNVTSGRSAWMDSLAARHRIDAPVREEYLRERSVVNYSGGLPFLEFEDVTCLEVRTDYALFAGRWFPAARSETVDGVERWREDVLSRDSRGNVTSVKERGAPRTDIAWSADGRYPVSVTEGAGSAAAQTTLYHWIPGIGPDEVNDPAGQKTYYTYDAAGRLTGVRDTDGNLVRDWTYSLFNTAGHRRRIATRTYRDADGTAYSTDISYWNALGMHLQDIAAGASGDGAADLVSAFDGDFRLHDDVRSWLPVPMTGTNGEYQAGAATAATAFHGSGKAYLYRGYEVSALDRVHCGAEPGYDGTHMALSGGFVLGGVPILQWDDATDAVVQKGTWPSSQVRMDVEQDADGRQALSLRDRTGRLLATYRRTEPGEAQEINYGELVFGVRSQPTLYIYDARDRLRAVAGPGIALSDTLSMWRYGYDALDRLSSRGFPGSPLREHYTYDSEDRVVRTVRGDDALQTEYDALGRVTAVRMTGDDALTHLVATHTYTGPYETERRLAIVAPDGSLGDCSGGAGSGPGYVRVLFSYDSKGRVIRRETSWPDGEVHVETTAYDFCSQPTGTVLTATRPGGGTAVVSTATLYDLRERPARTITSLSVDGVVAARDTTVFSYDALGRPAGNASSCASAGGEGAATLSDALAYNLQGRLASTAWSLGGRDFFSENLRYENPGISGVSGFTGSYAGKITGIVQTWHGGPSPDPMQLSSQTVRSVAYRYDLRGRLVEAAGYSASTSVPPLDPTVAGDIFSYDQRGNILRADPYFGNAHAFGGYYRYDGDRLTAHVSDVMHIIGGVAYHDTLATFSYDDRARMTRDSRDDTRFGYNYLGLTEKVTRGDSLVVKYSYLADGSRAEAERADGTGLVYRGSLTYRRDSSGALALEGVPFTAGRLTPGGVRYHVTDHLGSVRAVVDGATGDILEAGNYGVYGARSSAATGTWPTGSLPTGETLRHRFTGKEDQGPDFGLALTDFGARLYNPSRRRWLTPDPLGEKYYDISPYAYCAGDPVNLVDWDGRDIWEINRNGVVISRTVDDTQDAFYIVAMNKDGYYERVKDFEGNSIGVSFVYGTVEKSSYDAYGRHPVFELISNQDGGVLFKFLSDNTDVEHGYIGTADNYSTVFTNNDVRSVGMLQIAKRIIAEGKGIRIMMHNHPRNNPPSGFDKEMHDGDKAAAIAIKKMNQCDVFFYIYRPEFPDAVLKYDEKDYERKNRLFNKIEF